MIFLISFVSSWSKRGKGRYRFFHIDTFAWTGIAASCRHIAVEVFRFVLVDLHLLFQRLFEESVVSLSAHNFRKLNTG